MTVGELIRKKRGKLGFSQRELSARLGMSTAHLARIESGDRFPKSFIGSISGVLDLSEPQLLRMVMNDKLEDQLQGPYIAPEKIEDLTSHDRKLVLRVLGKESFRFPRDMSDVTQVLCGLSVIETDSLFSQDAKQVFAGIFPKGFLFQGESNVIAVATERVKSDKREPVSKQSRAFHVLHEVGHFRLHCSDGTIGSIKSQGKPDSPLYCSSGDRSRQELQANMYASAFLMPGELFREWIANRSTFNLQQDGKDWCELLFVEPHVLKRRLEGLGIRVR